MPRITCSVPIRIRISGRPTESDWDELAARLDRLIASRLDLAARVIGESQMRPRTGAEIVRTPARLAPGSTSER